jgi:hypothetical protein
MRNAGSWEAKKMKQFFKWWVVVKSFMFINHYEHNCQETHRPILEEERCVCWQILGCEVSLQTKVWCSISRLVRTGVQKRAHGNWRARAGHI